MRYDRDPAIMAVLFKYGNAVKLATELGISRQAVSRWTKIPMRHLATISEFTGMQPHELRPDVFGPKSTVS
jgi:DNA-binding transcriptional regulator YdaS (Cro superfamily)